MTLIRCVNTASVRLELTYNLKEYCSQKKSFCTNYKDNFMD